MMRTNIFCQKRKIKYFPLLGMVISGEYDIRNCGKIILSQRNIEIVLNVSFYLFLWSLNTHLHTENNTLSKSGDQQETTVATGGVSVTPWEAGWFSVTC